MGTLDANAESDNREHKPRGFSQNPSLRIRLSTLEKISTGLCPAGAAFRGHTWVFCATSPVRTLPLPATFSRCELTDIIRSTRDLGDGRSSLSAIGRK